MSNFRSLDQSQLEFVQSTAPRTRLLAPAGAGKTHSILHRCAALAEAEPNHKFLLVTFTKAAQNELNARLQRDPDFADLSANVRVSTLNSWGWRTTKNAVTNAQLLSTQQKRSWAMSNALQPTWEKYTPLARALTESRTKVKAGKDVFEILESLKTLGFRHDQISEEEIAAQVSWLEGVGLTPHLTKILRTLSELQIVNSADGFDSTRWQRFIKFWARASKQLYAQGLITFEDQKYWAGLALEKSIGEGRLHAGAARTHHVIVDEFQDINPLDLRLISAIVTINQATLTIVGDDDQAIYEWRGASPEFILAPERYFNGDFKTFVLEKNYRSPKNIVDRSQRLIAHNARRVPKTVQAHLRTKADIKVIRHSDIASCIYQTTDLVRDLLDREDIQSIALVSRKRSQILPYQITFAGEDTDFYAAEDLDIYLSDAFKELQEVLSIRGQAGSTGPWGPSPVEQCLQLANKVKKYKLSKTDLGSLSSHFQARAPQTMAETVSALRSYRGPLKGDNPGGAMSKSFADAIENLMSSSNVADSLRVVGSEFQGFQQNYGKSDEDIYYADPPFYYLSALAERFGSDYGAFYQNISKAMAKLPRTQHSDNDEINDEQLSSRVHLMTALRAKGREFDAVIVLDANDGIWPSKRAETEHELEGERRLFYVAATRARKFLAFVHSDEVVGHQLKVSPYIREFGL